MAECDESADAADAAGDSTAAFARLDTLLWNERLLLRRVRAQSLPADQLTAAAARLAELEILRAMESEVLAQTLGMSPTVTLAELAAAAPDPWTTILADHRGALLALSDAVSPVMQQRSLADFLG